MSDYFFPDIVEGVQNKNLSECSFFTSIIFPPFIFLFHPSTWAVINHGIGRHLLYGRTSCWVMSQLAWFVFLAWFVWVDSCVEYLWRQNSQRDKRLQICMTALSLLLQAPSLCRKCHHHKISQFAGTMPSIDKCCHKTFSILWCTRPLGTDWFWNLITIQNLAWQDLGLSP